MFLSLGFFPLAISTDICILVPRLIFNTNLASSMENRFVDGIVGMQVPLMCQKSLQWIATSNFLELKTHLASSIKLHDTILFYFFFPSYIFSLSFGFFSKIVKFILLTCKCPLLHSFQKKLYMLKNLMFL